MSKNISKVRGWEAILLLSKIEENIGITFSSKIVLMKIEKNEIKIEKHEVVKEITTRRLNAILRFSEFRGFIRKTKDTYESGRRKVEFEICNPTRKTT